MADPTPKNFDKDEFQNLLKMQCTEKEIVSFFSTTRNTLQKWVKKTYGKNFADVSKDWREAGKASLRRKLYNLADTNPGVAIFLAKNWLGMSDNPIVVPSLEETKELAHAISAAVKTMSRIDLDKLAQIPASAEVIEGEQIQKEKSKEETESERSKELFDD